MRFINIKRILFILLCSVSFFFVIRFWGQEAHNDVAHIGPIIIWWTPIIKNYHQIKQCGLYKCTFTVNRALMDDENTKGFAFYGSDMSISDFPLPRHRHHIWALFHEESPKNVPYIQFEPILRHFNISATFSRYSNLPLTIQFINSIQNLTSRKFLVPIGEKNKLRKKENLAPVAFVQSICDTMSGRDEYVRELMKYIEVDSYGKCLHNKDLPKSLSNDYLRTIESPDFYKFLARYKFILAYENGVCNDYITEKFWRPLIIGSVPVYFGAPTIRDWMPNKKSAILINDYDSPEQLATFLKFLDHNDQEYNKYLDHKYSLIEPITNKFLINTIMEKDYVKDNLFEDFECFLCKHLYNTFPTSINQQHYDCGGKLQFPQMSTKVDMEEWESILKNGKCQANTLDYFLVKNRNFTMKDFDSELVRRIQIDLCTV